MIAELRTYRFDREHVDTVFRRVADQAFPILDDLQVTHHGPWKRVDGDRAAVFYIVEWADEAAKDAGWATFRQDPRWTKGVVSMDSISEIWADRNG